MLESNGSIKADWGEVRRRMWGAFFRNCAVKGHQNLPLTRKEALLQRSVVPILRYRCARWPPAKDLLKKLDRMQFKMTAILRRAERRPCEHLENFIRRRNREAASSAKQVGLWSDIWMKGVIKWDEHLKRAT